ncbi:MAG: hypothetical protein JWO08_122, partial [Verrucomicrobiaceae bacterium]|nr:hypothetical protein [Verrucomicrobiaceae bacterium]
MAHTHLQLSNGSAAAILIKYGPGKVSSVIGWDRTNDTFVRTQCLKAKLELPDLSPDGQYFAYYVNTQTGREKSVRRVISRWPWLKALAFWSTSSWIYGPGPGLFTGAGNEMWAGEGVKAEWDKIGMKITSDLPVEWQSFVKGGLLFPQLQRDGWKPVAPWEICSTEEADGVANWLYSMDVHRIIFQKQLPNNNNRWKLQLTHWCGINGDENRGISFDTFALVSPEGVMEKCEGWCSADYDAVKGRIVWTRD